MSPESCGGNPKAGQSNPWLWRGHWAQDSRDLGGYGELNILRPKTTGAAEPTPQVYPQKSILGTKGCGSTLPHQRRPNPSTGHKSFSRGGDVPEPEGKHELFPTPQCLGCSGCSWGKGWRLLSLASKKSKEEDYQCQKQ